MRHMEFKEVNIVLVKLLPQQFKSFRKVHKGLVCKYEGSFEVIKRIGRVSYKLHLPPKLKIHLVFRVNEILANRVIHRRGVPSYKEYLIKWRGLPDTEVSWESENTLWKFKDKIERYNNQSTMRASRA
ncbi:hypothetical protein ACLB2K_007848 [Fragaria x ananassa]